MSLDRPVRLQPFERLTLRGKRWFFRMLAPNGKIIAPSQGYKSPGERDDTMRLIASSEIVITPPDAYRL